MSNKVPASALSPLTEGTPGRLAVGGHELVAPQSTSGYWYVVVDLTEALSVVRSEFSADNNLPPGDIAGLLGNPAYFLFLVAQRLPSGQLPQGELSRFLQAAGSGAQLAALEQAVAQLGTESFPWVSYVLGATLNDQDLPGFEEASLWLPSVLNMQFIALEVDGRTIYAPVQIGTPLSATMVRAVQSAGPPPFAGRG
jgi:hypothetical protein